MADGNDIQEVIQFLRNSRPEVVTAFFYATASLVPYALYVRAAVQLPSHVRMAADTTSAETLRVRSTCALQVRQLAVDLIKGLTGDTAGIVQLTKYKAKLLPELLHLISDRDKIQESATTSLVNLCQVCLTALLLAVIDQPTPTSLLLSLTVCNSVVCTAQPAWACCACVTGSLVCFVLHRMLWRQNVRVILHTLDDITDRLESAGCCNNATTH